MIINKELMRANECFGCGHENEHGIRMEIRRSPDGKPGLVGSFTPAAHMTGFPGLTHGGAVYSALDCLAAWTATMSRPERAIWILKSATVRYLRPTFPGREVRLSGRIVEQGEEMKPCVVQTDARDADERLLVRATFNVVPLAEDAFLHVSGLDEIPENWVQFMEAGFGVEDV